MEDFVWSDRELPGSGSGAGLDWFAEHRQGPPCEHKPLLQQRHAPSAPQQVACCPGAASAVRLQQECRARAELAQREHFAPGKVFAPAGFTAFKSAE